MIFKNFLNIKNNKKIKKDFINLIKYQPQLFETLKPTYKYSYSKKEISKYKNFFNIRVIGMGGSILGTEAIYHFLKKKIKKKITFVNNLNSNADYFQDKNITSVKGGSLSIEEMIGQNFSADTNQANNTSSNSIEKLIIKKINEQ